MPYTFVGVRAFRLVRLLRIFKLNRYSDALAAIGGVFRRKAQQIVASIFFVSIILVLASLLIYYAEHDAQPEQFENAFSGLWWAVATLTTVGYGDIYPITPIGRFLGAIIAILGIGMVAVPTSILSAGFMEKLEQHAAAKQDPEGKKENGQAGPPQDKNAAPAGHAHAAADADSTFEPPQYCPHCGKKLFP
jgi:voltage-gated potassium channel